MSAVCLESVGTARHLSIGEILTNMLLASKVNMASGMPMFTVA